MSRKITVVVTGYVGLIAAIGFADFGNDVIGVDIDKEKIDNLNKGISPIYEQGIYDYLDRNEYRSLNLNLVANLMKNKTIIDTSNMLQPDKAKELGFTYEGVGRK